MGSGMNRFQIWLCNWADLFSGLVGVLTLGYYYPWWDMKLRVYFSNQMLKKRMGR